MGGQTPALLYQGQRLRESQVAAAALWLRDKTAVQPVRRTTNTVLNVLVDNVAFHANPPAGGETEIQLKLHNVQVVPALADGGTRFHPCARDPLNPGHHT